MKLITFVLLGLGLVVLHVDACRRLTAAFRFGDGKAHLFFGNDYAILYKNNTEEEAGDVHDRYGVNNPDAAFIFNRDDHLYFFSGEFYFAYFNKDWNAIPARFFGGRATRFFDNGLDAAGNVKDSTYFFRGCKYILDLPQGPSNEMDMPEGAPCNLNAALTDDDNLMMFKDDQMWLMKPQGDTVVVDDPVQTSSVLELKDIVLCKEGEHEE